MRRSPCKRAESRGEAPGVSRRRLLLSGLMAAPGAVAAASVMRIACNYGADDWRTIRWRARGATVCLDDTGEYELRADGGATYGTNGSGVLLWRLCDGSRTGAELVDALSAHGRIRSEQAIADTAAFLKLLADEGLLERA
ncbi:MAG: PqqD family protein [Myxococcota bacterium]